jgi:hypothetical protein
MAAGAVIRGAANSERRGEHDDVDYQDLDDEGYEE